MRTGYEAVVAHRTGDLFSGVATGDGKVISLNATGIVIEYEDGTTQGFTLGRRYGNSAGLTIPQTLKTDLKVGDVVKKGQVVIYNSGWFERDNLNPSEVIFKGSALVRVALLESADTLEDSCALSVKTCQLLRTDITSVKTVVVNFDQAIRSIVKVGSTVEAEDILCTIEEATTAGSDLLDESDLDSLRLLGAQTPRAGAKGVVERIEVYYHGDTEDMTDSLRSLAKSSDKELAARARSSAKPVFTGSVDDGFRIDGDPLVLDQVAIRFYITTSAAMAEGDKLVFANQMKSVVGRTFTAPVMTESSLEIGAIFGQKSIDDRIVESPALIGTTNALLAVVAKRAVKAYES